MIARTFLLGLGLAISACHGSSTSADVPTVGGSQNSLDGGSLGDAGGTTGRAPPDGGPFGDGGGTPDMGPATEAGPGRDGGQTRTTVASVGLLKALADELDDEPERGEKGSLP